MQSPYGKLAIRLPEPAPQKPEPVARRLKPAPLNNVSAPAFLRQDCSEFPGAMETGPVESQERSQIKSNPYKQWRELRRATPPSSPLPPLPVSPSPSEPSSPLSDSGGPALHSLTLSRGTDDSSGDSSPALAAGLENATWEITLEKTKAIARELQAPPPCTPMKPAQPIRRAPLLDLNESSGVEETIEAPSLSLPAAFILDERPTTSKPSLDIDPNKKRSRDVVTEVESEAQAVRGEEQRKKPRADSKTSARPAGPRIADPKPLWHGGVHTKSAPVKKKPSPSLSRTQRSSNSAYEDSPLRCDEPAEFQGCPSKRAKQGTNMRKSSSGKDASFWKAYEDLEMVYSTPFFPPPPKYQEDEESGEELLGSEQDSGLRRSC